MAPASAHFPSLSQIRPAGLLALDGPNEQDPKHHIETHSKEPDDFSVTSTSYNAWPLDRLNRMCFNMVTS